MSKRTKVILAVASVLVFVGAVVFAVSMAYLEWDFTKFSNVEYEIFEYEINEEFDSISVDTLASDVVFLLSDDNVCKVISKEHNKVRYSVRVDGSKLMIKAVDTRKWYEHIGINFGSGELKVYLPAAEYKSLVIKCKTSDIEIPNQFKFKTVDIKSSTGGIKCLASVENYIKIITSTGDITLKDITAYKIDISVSTGKTTLEDVDCENLIVEGNTGDVILKDVVASEKFLIETDTGDVKLEKSDAKEISIETDTGDIKGTLLTGKIFVAESDTGRINVPDSSNGGKCKLETDTGDIVINIVNP